MTTTPELECAPTSSHADAPRCPVCAMPLIGDLRYCDRCASPHHIECWDYAGGCAIFGCLSAPPSLPPDRHTALSAVQHARLLQRLFRLQTTLLVSAGILTLAVTVLFTPFLYPPLLHLQLLTNIALLHLLPICVRGTVALGGAYLLAAAAILIYSRLTMYRLAKASPNLKLGELPIHLAGAPAPQAASLAKWALTAAAAVYTVAALVITGVELISLQTADTALQGMARLGLTALPCWAFSRLLAHREHRLAGILHRNAPPAPTLATDVPAPNS